ncbi:hypothetical protein GOP47_0005882 [Adiantum capillus-veneris]|uniref:Carbohydrate binding module family 25 domain-containing protein n=1 Tax=Adiantum capillus-veneris TaxID=13818 RepID=A0A9D4V1U8_ADICA|nr:hypothetical protein GOP47_0005882 [Adiantum capillus-veneris]
MEACTAATTSLPDSSLQRGSSFPLAAPAGTRLHCAYVSKERTRAWKAVRAIISNSSSAGSSDKRSEQESNGLEDVAMLFDSCEQLKVIVDSSASSGVGTDMRNRVDHLLKRVRMLKQSAERAARGPGGRLPSQLIASLKALQREHGSLENILRLATEAGPVLIEEEGNNLENSGLAVVAQKADLSRSYVADTVDVELARGQDNGTPVEVLSGPKYVMSTPFREGSFQLSAVRAEIERRVMEQLSKKQGRFYSKEELTKRREEFQKVPSVNQRCLGGDKNDLDNAVRMGKASMVDAHSVCNKEEEEFEVGRREMESGSSIELHEQTGRKFDEMLSDLREELSDVIKNLKEREDSLLVLEEKLMGEQRKLSDKINELSGEVKERLTGEQLSNTLGKVILDREEDLKRIESQLASLCSDLNMKDKILAGWRNEQEKIRQEFQAGFLRLESRLHQVEGVFEGFSPQSVLAELRSLKVTLTALQEGQSFEQSKLANWQTKVEHLERSLLSNAQQIKKLTSEVEGRVWEGDMKDMLNKVLNEVEMQSKKLQERMECVSAEQVKTATSLGLLQEEWRAHRKELQRHIEDVEDKLVFLETTQNQGVLLELSTIKNKLSELQDEQKHERSVVLEAQQQMVVLEGKGLDLLRRMNEDAEVQKQDLLEEVRILVDELLRNSNVHQRDGIQESVSLQESNATVKDGGYLRKNSSSNHALGSKLSVTVSTNDQRKVAIQEGAQVRDKGTASLEAFFSVMGNLIREELKKMDDTSAQTLPLNDLHQSADSTQGLTSSSMDKTNPCTTDGGNQKQHIVLRYDSTWKTAFIHYCADNLGWTKVPGILMQDASDSEGKYRKEFKIKAARLEFVVTDGQGNWDQAPNGNNYLLETPGIFDLRSGVLKAASLF